MLRRLFTGAIGSVATAAAAQTPAQLDVFKAINAAVPAPAPAAVNAEAMLLLKIMVDKKLASCLPTAISVGEISPATSSNLAAKGINAKQLKNAWTTYGKLEGCPGTMPTRFLVVRLADDRLLVRVANTGETLTTTSQMRDTVGDARLAASLAVRRAIAGCEGDDMPVLNTRIASRAADLGPDIYGTRYAGSWREVWRFKACGREVDVPIDFRADSTGAISTHFPLAEVTLVEP